MCLYKHVLYSFKQGRHIKVSMSHVRVINLLWEGNMYYTFRMCVFSLSCPACNARAPCYEMACLAMPWGFYPPQYLTNGRISGRSLLNKKHDSIFCTNLMYKSFCFNTFIIFLYMFRALLCSSSGGQLC